MAFPPEKKTHLYSFLPSKNGNCNDNKLYNPENLEGNSLNQALC